MGLTKYASLIALLGVQSQANQGQPLSVSMVNQPSARQQILSQNIQNNTLAMAQNPANLSSAFNLARCTCFFVLALGVLVFGFFAFGPLWVVLF